MTESEFKKQALRIIAAFGFWTEGPLGIRPLHCSLWYKKRYVYCLDNRHPHKGELWRSHRSTGELVQDDPLHLEHRIEYRDFHLRIQRRREATASDPFSFTMQDVKTGGTAFFIRMTPEQIMQAEVTPDYTPRMLFGLGKLGYDVVALSEQFSIPLSAQEKMDWTEKYQQTRKTPILKTEFEREVRPILAAFDQDSQAPLEIKHEIYLRSYDKEFTREGYGHLLECSFTAHSFVLHIGRSINTGDDKFFIGLSELKTPNQRERKTAQFIQSKGQQVVHTKESGECEHLLLTALSTLGYDVISLCEQASIELSNHEKIELALIYRKTNPNPHPNPDHD